MKSIQLITVPFYFYFCIVAIQIIAYLITASLLICISRSAQCNTNNNYITGMFPVGDTSCRTLIAAVCVCVCLSADISLNCAKND